MRKIMATGLILISTLMFSFESFSSPVINSQNPTSAQSDKLKKLLAEKNDLEQQSQKLFQEIIDSYTKMSLKHPISPDCQQETNALQGDTTKFSKKCLDEERGQLKYIQNHQDDYNEAHDRGQKIRSEILQNQLNIIKELEKVAS